MFIIPETARGQERSQERRVKRPYRFYKWNRWIEKN